MVRRNPTSGTARCPCDATDPRSLTPDRGVGSSRRERCGEGLDRPLAATHKIRHCLRLQTTFLPCGERPQRCRRTLIPPFGRAALCDVDRFRRSRREAIEQRLGRDASTMMSRTQRPRVSTTGVQVIGGYAPRDCQMAAGVQAVNARGSERARATAAGSEPRLQARRGSAATLHPPPSGTNCPSSPSRRATPEMGNPGLLVPGWDPS